jgi:hypothetical protein
MRPGLRAACLPSATLLLGAALLSVSGSAAATPLPRLSISIAAGSITVSGATESGALDVVTSAASSLRQPSTVLVRLKLGVTVAQLTSYLAKNKTGEPDTIAPYGSIVFDQQARPGASSEAQTSLAPGSYVALDGEGEKSSRWSHASFTIAASPAPALLPTPSAVERTSGFAFEGPGTLRRGQLVRFENDGFVVYMDLAFRTRSRSAAERLAEDLLKGRRRAAEKLVAGVPANFAGALSLGAEQQETITAAPGFYVQASFVETRGRPDTRLGMERVIRIVR